MLCCPGKAGEVRRWAAIDSCCLSTVGTRQPESTETFAFRIITPGREELTQMVSKFARKQYYNTQFKALPPPNQKALEETYLVNCWFPTQSTSVSYTHVPSML